MTFCTIRRRQKASIQESVQCKVGTSCQLGSFTLGMEIFSTAVFIEFTSKAPTDQIFT